MSDFITNKDVGTILMELLTRDQFRETVLSRDHHKCVVCDKPAADAHHILDRSLFENGGYYLDNGVSLCEEHHLEAEMTKISCEELRKKACIANIVLPEHFDENSESIETFDHWGNILLSTGMRVRGELFYQENVHKILDQAGLLNSFLKYIKYPRTYHAPWSPDVSKDDRIHSSMLQFLDRSLILTIKFDGENANLYPDYCHARSINSGQHESRDWLKAFHARIAHEIPANWRLCGENLYAMHSILYKHLKSFFYLISIWDETNTALNWEDTVGYADILNLQIVPYMYLPKVDTVEELKSFAEKEFDNYCRTSLDEVEGYVIRIADRIPYREYRKYTAKVVRKGHVQTDAHWLTQKVTTNVLEAYYES